MQGFAYFSSIVYRDEKPEWVKHVNKLCDPHFDHVDQIRCGDTKTYPTVQTADLSRIPELSFVADYFVTSSKELLRTQGYDVDKYEFFLAGMWGQRIDTHGGFSVHTHGNSQMCGFLFLETPEGGSYPIFEDTRVTKAMVALDSVPTSEITNATPSVHFNNLVPGTALFTNSWVPHQFSGNNSSIPTKTIHFVLTHRMI